MASLTMTKEGHWRQTRPGDPHHYLYAIEGAKSSRGRCRKCSECVPKGELRFGIPIRDPRGEYGYISAWQHLGCTRVEERGDDLVPFIAGLAELPTKEERDRVVEEITSSVIPPHLKALDADDLVKRGVLERAECPPTMLQHLLPFQLEGLGWMASQELTEYKGGILADEMGMGKTIQTISLILKNKGSGPTLVVCPVSSMNQWEEEINKNVVPGTLEVMRVTKTTRIDKDKLMAVDVVLTTYPVLELSYRLIVNKAKVACKYCAKMFLPRQLKNHNKYFCGPNAQKTAKQSKQETSRKRDKDGRQKGGDDEDIVFHTIDDDDDDANPSSSAVAATASSASLPPKPQRSSKVQSKETILKGLRTLHIDVADLEAEADVHKEEGGRAGGGRKSAPAPKKKASAPSPGGGAAAGDDGAAGDGGLENISGPMSMMRNLMKEAGRKVRGRWERRREDTDSEEDGGDESSADDSADEGGLDDVSEEGEEEEGPSEEGPSEEGILADELKCPDCGFQKLRYPFCPRTGQEHVTADEEALNRAFLGETGDIADSALHSIHWFRIILDEAHRIKTRTSNTSRSIYSLKGERKWCITGTPLQNRVGDLYSLLRFLQVAPYAKYYCCAKGCSCTSLCHPFSWSSLRACVFCGHGPLHHYSYFNKHIMNPINRLGYIGEGKKALMLLTNGVLNALMLRRTKAERSEELKMPPMTVLKQKVSLTPEERDMYDALYKRSASNFDTFVKKGTMLHNYAHIFQLLSRLRQALDHPYLVTRTLSEDVVVGHLAVAAHVCAICQDDVAARRSVVVEPCKHAFHAGCLQHYVDEAPLEASGGKLSCPACFVPITFDYKRMRELEEEGEVEAGAAGGGDGADEDDDDEAIVPAGPPQIAMQGGGDDDEDGDEILVAAPPPGDAVGAGGAATASATKSSKGGKKGHAAAPKGIMSKLSASHFVAGSKMKAMLEYIQKVPKDEKCIVFSQFGGMLDLLEFYFARFGGLHCVKLTGSQPMPVRQSILNAFRNDPTVRVILISLKAGGEGLNLQNANHVLLSDPWWNPAVEMQAVQRAHRIGQTRRVTAVRFVTENSVEERMIELQDKKMLVFEGTIDGKAGSLHRLSEEDMQFLFAR